MGGGNEEYQVLLVSAEDREFNLEKSEMNEGPIDQGNMIETTDCLEAVGVFRGWKNFFFLVVFFVGIFSPKIKILIPSQSHNPHYIILSDQLQAD